MIKLNKKWAIGADSMNITLYKKRKVREDGKEPAWGAEGHYSSLHNALKALADKEVMDSELATIIAVETRLNEVYKLIEKLPNVTLEVLREDG